MSEWTIERTSDDARDVLVAPDGQRFVVAHEDAAALWGKITDERRAFEFQTKLSGEHLADNHKKQLDAAMEDTKRLDWLETHEVEAPTLVREAPNLREALDAALAKIGEK